MPEIAEKQLEVAWESGTRLGRPSYRTAAGTPFHVSEVARQINVQALGGHAVLVTYDFGGPMFAELPSGDIQWGSIDLPHIRWADFKSYDDVQVVEASGEEIAVGGQSCNYILIKGSTAPPRPAHNRPEADRAAVQRIAAQMAAAQPAAHRHLGEPVQPSSNAAADLVDWTGLPMREVASMVGVSPRRYQDWVRGDTISFRYQHKLQRLRALVAVLVSMHGRAGTRDWFITPFPRTGTSPLQMLQDGKEQEVATMVFQHVQSPAT